MFAGSNYEYSIITLMFLVLDTQRQITEIKSEYFLFAVEAEHNNLEIIADAVLVQAIQQT